MPNFRRYYVPNAIYFIVAVTRNRRTLFTREENVDVLSETMHSVQRRKPFMLWAYSFIPDHINLLLQPTGEANISRIMLSIQRSYTLNYKEVHEISHSLSLWQARFWDHIIRDEEDLRHYFDYIHYNPVKHGLVTHPEDCSYSSYYSSLDKV